jgi:integrase
VVFSLYYMHGQRQELQGQEYLNFINAIHSEETKRLYIRALKHYMRFLKTDNLSSLLKQDTKTLEQQIISYLVSMKEQQLSFSMLNNRLMGIKKCYQMNDLVLNWVKISQYLGENTRKFKDRAYTTEEIQTLLTKADERMRVVILLLSSTGMRIGGAIDLKLRHLTKIEKYGLYQIVVYENTTSEYYTFCSPECAIAIDSYLAYRSRCYEKINPESPLIREQFNRNNPDSSRNPRHLPLNTLSHILRDLLIASGIHEVEHLTETKTNGRIKKQVARAHGFRKFATTNMIRAKLNPEAREMLLGHSIQLGDSYYRPLSNELLEEYLRAVDLLTINDENRLKRKVEILEVKKEKIDQLASTLETVKRKLGLD